MKQEANKKSKSRVSKLILFILIIIAGIYVLNQKGYISSISLLNTGENGTLKHIRDIVELDASKKQEIIVNQNQLIIATEDGVRSLSLSGEDIWADTHTLKNINIAQRAPYFAIGEKMGYKLSVYDTHGKKCDLQFANPIGYFSLNKQGDVVVIENTIDGHIVSAYDAKGQSLGIKHITYIEDAGYPMTAEISPDGNMILVSYLDTNDVAITSNIIGIEVGTKALNKVDNILYGMSYPDTLVTEIEFVNQYTWVLVGDNLLTFNNLDGDEITSYPNKNIKYAPVLNRNTDWQGIIYSVISVEAPAQSTVHPVETLSLFNQTGEEVFTLPLDNKSMYMYNDGKTVIIGSDRKFVSYNRLGKKRWEYTATKDIRKVIQLYSDRQVVMVSKSKIELMQVVK